MLSIIEINAVLFALTAEPEERKDLWTVPEGSRSQKEVDARRN